jgi:hypothetical protein
MEQGGDGQQEHHVAEGELCDDRVRAAHEASSVAAQRTAR